MSVSVSELARVAGDWWTVVTLVGAAVEAARRYLYQPIRTVIRRLDKVEANTKHLDAIEAELHPNGGSSLRDAVDTAVEAIDHANAMIVEHRAEATARVDQLDVKLDTHIGAHQELHDGLSQDITNLRTTVEDRNYRTDE